MIFDKISKAGLEPVGVYIKSITYKAIGNKMAKTLPRKGKSFSFLLMSKGILKYPGQESREQ